MLNSISWEQYLIFVACGLFIYYLGILVFYYRSDLINRLSSGRSTNSKKATEPKYYNPFSANPGSLMGSIIQEEGENKIHIKNKEIGEADGVNVGAITTDKEHPEDEKPPLPSPETLLLGSVADLLKEVKTLIPLLSENDGSKEDFQKLFSALLARNSQLRQTSYQDAINLFIYNETKERFHFEITIQEVKELWN